MAATERLPRRGTDAEHNDFTGAEGEITVVTDSYSIRVHDGKTIGGIKLVNRDQLGNFSTLVFSSYDNMLSGTPPGTGVDAPSSGVNYANSVVLENNGRKRVYSVLSDPSGPIYSKVFDSGTSEGSTENNLVDFGDRVFNPPENPFDDNIIPTKLTPKISLMDQGFTDNVWYGPGAMLSNGDIGYPPYSTDGTFKIFSPSSGKFYETYFPRTDVRSWGGALAKNGHTYFAPTHGYDIFSIAWREVWNAYQDYKYTLTSGPVLSYRGAVSNKDCSKIYFIPFDCTQVLRIDILETTQSFSFISTSLPGSQKWSGGVLAPDDNIYCVPYDSEDMLVINTITDTIDLVAITGVDGADTSGKWSGGCLGPNGKIYMAPYNHPYGVELDPVTRTFRTVTQSFSQFGKFSGATLGPDGNVYFIPHGITITGWDNDRTSSGLFVIEIDVVEDTTTFQSYADVVLRTGEGHSRGWQGGILGRDGRIYCGSRAFSQAEPSSTRKILVIDPNTIINNVEWWGLMPQVNKF